MFSYVGNTRRRRVNRVELVESCEFNGRADPLDRQHPALHPGVVRSQRPPGLQVHLERGECSKRKGPRSAETLTYELFWASLLESLPCLITR